MNVLGFTRLPLRARFLLWQLAVLAPLLLTAIVGQFYLLPRLVEPLRDISDEVTEEVIQVKDLQVFLLMAGMPVNDYLIHRRRSEVGRFKFHQSRVDQGFEEARHAPFGEAGERQLVESAWLEWQKAKQLATELLRQPAPNVAPHDIARMEAFDADIERAVQLLEDIYNKARLEIKEAQAESDAARARAVWLTVIAFSVALVASLLIGYLLARCIISGLEALGMGAAAVAAGQPVEPIQTNGGHEFARLVESFNTMAERVRAHDAALQKLAVHDELTGLENRRAFFARLDGELKRVGRYHHPLALMMLDIDHFKAVNDTYGHAAGDAVLRRLAEIMEKNIRPFDQVARYGGEEFVILVPETTIEGALAGAERLRMAVADTPFHIEQGKTIDVTVSIGVAACPRDADTGEGLIKAADDSLYQAKRGGRNRVRKYS
jgi:diguanylate cyclase (GGDEF)-like protein